MAFNFDQFNNTSFVKPSSSVGTSDRSQIPPSDYSRISKNDERNIFQKSKMNLSLPATITHLCVANDWLIILMSNQLLFRLNLKHPDKQSEVFLEKFITGQKVSKVFLDPTGTHFLISLVPKSSGYSAELMYLNKNSNKPKIINKFHDHEVTAVGFNFQNTSENSTGNILLGTSRGLIFEADIGSDGEKVIQNNWKQVFDIGRGEKEPVTGLGYYRAPGTNNYIVLISTLERLYKFHEVLQIFDEKYPTLQNIFTHYLNVPEEARDFEQMSSKLTYSSLDFIYHRKFPKAFGWLTEGGIFLGEVHQLSNNPNFITSRKTIDFPENDNSSYSASYNMSRHQSQVPNSFVLTDFHVLLQYSDHVTGISLINHSIVYDEYFADQYGRLMSIVKDPENGNIYTFSNKTIFRYKINDEQRDVWRMYLEQNDFEKAKKFSFHNPHHYDVVLCRIAEDNFEKKLFMESAKVFSQTRKSFEEVTLKFLQINESLPLIYYLKSRLNDCSIEEDQMHITMIVVWIVELYLTEMNRSTGTSSLERQKEFDEFMSQPKVEMCLKNNRKLLYDIIASHGDNYNLTSLTTLNEDYEEVMNHYLQDNEFQDALDTLKVQRKTELFYKFMPIIIEKLPKESIQLLIERGKNLNVSRLLPTLLNVKNEKHAVEVVKYLEFSIHSLGVQDQSVHNYLIQLYAKQKEEDKLMSYFETQGKEVSMLHYDVHYALRLCKEFSMNVACVFLLCLMELWQKAVELALTFDSKLAQQTASQPMDRALKRKLWLIIAEHEISGKDNIQEALELLKICDLLKIEDLLPFFSDFQEIDHFKDTICDSLKEYNNKIKDQKKEMNESAEAAQTVRESIQSFRNRSVTICAHDKCSRCSNFLLLRPFFLFPCSHKFHADCLEKNLIELLTPEEGQKLIKHKQKLSILNTQIEMAKNQNNSVPTSTVEARDQQKQYVEDILTAECTLCGSLMIQQLDQQFNVMNETW
ncbi:CLUMA_CG017630, isoform A [Clunio marinus]|uniref:Vacuolar protein sorting-associated protein 18 homolog n=1 Tax=Clunio marinus TaxID=568069 RepID=A0A1J1IWM3_9DIPT|nr:CLUMA_CG017630, isoform A [Clunio marinus]